MTSHSLPKPEPRIQAATDANVAEPLRCGQRTIQRAPISKMAMQGGNATWAIRSFDKKRFTRFCDR
jgi:hypothetical protein